MDTRLPASQPPRVPVYEILWCVTESFPHLSRSVINMGAAFIFTQAAYKYECCHLFPGQKLCAPILGILLSRPSKQLEPCALRVLATTSV